MALGLPSGLRADGKYWPERAYEAPPRIPAQRAVLAFREGLETLVIESSTESPSRSLGWIIPVPSEPLAAEEIRPGLFESLALILGPTVVHDLSRELRWAGWLFACMAICALLFALKVRLGWVLSFALGAALLSLFAAATIRGMKGRGGLGQAAAPGVTVTASRRVGSYEVETLRATGAGSLDAWLDGRGFAGLSAAERDVVDDYIRRSWRFVAARIARGEGGAATPHPILLRFEAPQPVYPLRLTGLAGGATELDIFVVADAAAAPRFAAPSVLSQGGGQDGDGPPTTDASGLLRTAFANRFRKWEDPDTSMWWSGEEPVRTGIGHPDLEGIFWDGCVVTRLRGTLEPEAMGRDLVMRWKTTLRPSRERCYSLRGAISIGGIVSLFVGGCALVGISLALSERRRTGSAGDPRRYAIGTLGVLLGAAVLGGIVALALPVREVRLDRQRGHFFYPDVQGSHLSSILERAFRSDGPRDLDSARSRIAAAIAADWKKAWIEGVDGIERLHEADLLGPAPVELAAPWGYEVREEGGEIRVYLYGPWACPELVWPAP